MDDGKGRVENLGLRGGNLCLNFVNTVDWRGGSKSSEYLNTFHDAVIWGRHVGILTDHDVQKLLRKAEECPVKAERVLRQTINLREALYRIFISVIQEIVPEEKDLATFNENFSKTMAHSRIVKTETGFLWDSSGDKERLDWMLNPILHSAADLLISDELKRIKQCNNPKCDWFFLDKSRNRSRNWCDMKVCGNRAKARRFYRRKKRAISS